MKIKKRLQELLDKADLMVLDHMVNFTDMDDYNYFLYDYSYILQGKFRVQDDVIEYLEHLLDDTRIC